MLFRSRGNASSFECALRDVGERPFLLAMADHICESSLLRTFLSECDGQIAVAVDRSRMDAVREEEATKAALQDGRVVEIGKVLRRWDGVDTGFSYWSQHASALAGDAMFGGELAALMAALARRGINEVLVEAGATLAGALLGEELVDTLSRYPSPLFTRLPTLVRNPAGTLQRSTSNPSSTSKNSVTQENRLSSDCRSRYVLATLKCARYEAQVARSCSSMSASCR